MKTSWLSVSGAAAVLAAAMAVSSAQAPQQQGPPAGAPQGHPHMTMPAPKNLQVLPKDLTGDQVHEIMHGWAAALGTECGTCHAVDPKNVGPNGRPRLNFADDSKPEKRTARLMYEMTEKINSDYISMVPDSNQKVSCGTCHRGHKAPEPFIPPPEHGPEHHEGMPAPQPK